MRFIGCARRVGLPMSDIRELVSLWRDKSRSSASVKQLGRKHIEMLRRISAELRAMVVALEDLTRGARAGTTRPMPFSDTPEHATHDDS